MNYNFEKTSPYYVQMIEFLNKRSDEIMYTKNFNTFNIAVSSSSVCVRSLQEDRNIITFVEETEFDTAGTAPSDPVNYRILQRNNHLYISPLSSSYLYNEIFSQPNSRENADVVAALSELDEELLFQYSTLYSESVTGSLKMDFLVRDIIPKNTYLNIDLACNAVEILEPIWEEMRKLKRP